MLLPAGRMNSKSKKKKNIYKKIIEEVCRKYEGAQEFFTYKVKNYVLKKEYLLRRYIHSL